MDNGQQKIFQLLLPLPESLDFFQSRSKERPKPRLHDVDLALGFDEVHGVVDGGIEVEWIAAEIRTDKDATRNFTDHVSELHVDVHRGPLFAGRHFVSNRLLGLGENDRVQACWGYVSGKSSMSTRGLLPRAGVRSALTDMTAR